MTDSDKRDAFTLKRWSQRKLAAARAAQAPSAPVEPPPQPAAPAAHAAGAPPPAPPQNEPRPLPPVDSLTIDSDFSAFLRPDVDESLRRSALRKLFSDPRFNVMDGLDVYIDDYSKPDPLPEAVARSLAQARYILDPPATRVNAAGQVEDVPADADATALAKGEAPDAPALEPPAESRQREPVAPQTPKLVQKPDPETA